MVKRKRGAKSKVETKKRPRADGRDDEPVEEEPDKRASSYYHDEVDEFHSERDKIPVDTRFAGQKDDSDSEEEVLALESDGSGTDDDLDDEMSANLSRLQRNLVNEEMASDLEDAADDGLPDSKAWGMMKHKYYGADVRDDDDVDSDGSEMAAAELEEQEALAIQKRLAEQLDDQDFGLDAFKPTKKVVGEREEIIVTKDLSKLSRREKIELLKKESPEFLDLVEDYKVKMKEAQDVLHPVLVLVRNGILPSGPAADYVDTKFRLILSYCVNVSFYLMLKAKHAPVHNHPVINRIVQYRGLLQQLEVADQAMQPNLLHVLEQSRNGEEIGKVQKRPSKKAPRSQKREPVSTKSRDKMAKKKVSELLDDSSDESEAENVETGGVKKKKVASKPQKKVASKAPKSVASKPPKSVASKSPKKKSDMRFETNDERAALEYYEMMKAGRRSHKDGASSEDEELADARSGRAGKDAGPDNDGGADLAGADDNEADEMTVGLHAKRGITKQIEKNRGLTPRRSKEAKNPRVKHRKKYQKAKVRRRGAVREHRPEKTRYGGELSGIRAGVKKSIKLK